MDGTRAAITSNASPAATGRTGCSIDSRCGYTTIDEHTSDSIARMRSVADAMRVDLGLPTLRVATDDGYEPGLDAIVDFVTAGRQPTA